MMTGCDYMNRSAMNSGQSGQNTRQTIQQNPQQNQRSNQSCCTGQMSRNPPETVTVPQSSTDGAAAFALRAIPQQNFDTPEMMGSMQMVLSHNIGEYVLVEFLIGTERLMRKQGILYHVGTSYITLYDDQNNNFIVCDIFSIKFVYFYFPGQRPGQNFNSIYSSGD